MTVEWSFSCYTSVLSLGILGGGGGGGGGDIQEGERGEGGRGHRWACNSLTQSPIETKLCKDLLLNEHTKTIIVKIVLNNAALVKQQ